MQPRGSAPGTGPQRKRRARRVRRDPLDPKYAKAWSRLGRARLRRGHCKRAKAASERAVQLGGEDASSQARKGFADAERQLEERNRAVKAKTDPERQHGLVSGQLEEDWEVIGRAPELHSRIHEQQVEGLLRFAERIRWPHVNEARDHAEEAYPTIRGGGLVNVHLHDWLFGVVLPGKWFTFKTMTALVLCTPSAPYYDCGLVLPAGRSYRRQRTVLGRVLGCPPGVVALYGWVGPCPPVTIASPPLSSSQSKPNPTARYIRIKTRRVASSHHHRPDQRAHADPTTRARRTDEELEPYIADLTDPSQWIVPEPPITDISTWTISNITLTPLSLTEDAARPTRKPQHGEEETDETERDYRASIAFARDDNKNNGATVVYKLYTNPCLSFRLLVTILITVLTAQRKTKVRLRHSTRYI